MRNKIMKKMLLIVAIMLISSCSVFVADHLGNKQPTADNHSPDKVFCTEHPDKCH